MKLTAWPSRFVPCIAAASLAFFHTSTAAMSSTPNSIQLTLSAPTPPGSADDIGHLKRLAAGVGWEFSPNAETSAGLKRIGIKTIRCINVDRIAGTFTADGRFRMDGPPHRLDKHLATCAELGARPHVIIGAAVPDALRLSVEDARQRLAILGQTPGKRTYWNGDWPRLRAYWKAIFRHVLLDKGFGNARFEVGNEPDIDGQFPRLPGQDTPMGSASLYAAYYDVYKNVALAAAEFEAEHPGTRVRLGGPALAWAYTFRFGDFNWLEKFLEDSAKDHLRVDFIGVHFYGNISSLHGEYKAAFPSFAEMMASARRARDRFHPGTPILLTEWGPSYKVNNEPAALVNADYRGAAWSAAFLQAMLEQKVDEALFLVTTDLEHIDPETQKPENVWGWPSFFVNPQRFDRAWPKAPYHVFDMVNRLETNRLTLQGARAGVDGIAGTNNENTRATLLLWNYGAEFPEKAAPTRLGREARVHLRIDLPRLAHTASAFTLKTWMISETMSDARSLFAREGRLDARCELQLLEERALPTAGAAYALTLPPCSVAFVEITPQVHAPASP